MKKIYSTSLLFSFLFFICALVGSSQAPTSQTFNASGTYTINPGYSAVVTIEAWGGGAGGGSGAAERGGGGGGAYASTTTTLTAGSYTVTVGTGGAVGVAGGNSSFAATVIAAGGLSTTTITGGAGGTVAGSTGTIRFAGGAGGNGATGGGAKGGGGGGGSANPGSNGGVGGDGTNNPTNLGGAGGTGTGAGGRGADGDGTPDAVAGTAPGGGGGGRGSAGGTSQAGAAGRVVVTVSSVLPVRLKTFKAIKKTNSVDLEWNSESEANLNSYIIEKSTDGVNFSALNSIAARNSSNSETYKYTDAAGNANVMYYRIAMTELDGKVTFSRIVKVESTSKGTQLQVYPNPVRGGIVNFITPQLAKGVYSVEVFNNSAQVVYKMRYTHSGGALSQSIQLPESLKPGIYSIHINDGQVKYQHNFLIQ